MLTKRSHKLIVATVIWLPIIIILTVSVFFMYRYYRQLLGQADKLIMDDLARRFNLGVRAGRTDFNTLGIAILENVEIAAERTFEHGRIFYANKVIIRYSPSKLLLGRGAASISSVDLVEPKLLLIRQKDGRFNIANIFKPAVPPIGHPFEGVVRISKGKLTFKDSIYQVNGAPAFIVVQNISGAVSASSHPKYVFNVAGTGKIGQLGKLNVIGTYDSFQKVTQLDITAQDVSASYASNYLPIKEGISIAGGNAKVILGLTIKRAKERLVTNFNGLVKIRNGTVRINQINEPVRNIQGSIIFTNKQLALDLEGTSSQSQFKAKGAVVDSKDYNLDIELSSPFADYGRIVKLVQLPNDLKRVRISGRGPLKVRITGIVANPKVHAQLRIPQVAYAGFNAKNVALSVIYKAGSITIQSARFGLLGADFFVQGRASIGNVPLIDIYGNVSGLQARRLPLPSRPQITGTASGNFRIFGTSASPVFNINAAISNGSFLSLPFNAASLRASYKDGVASIQNLRISRLAGGTIAAAGKVKGDSMDLIATAENIDLSRLARVIGQPGVFGIGFFDGRIYGKVSSPIAAGNLEVFNGRIDKYVFDYFRASLKGNMQRVDFKSAVLHVFPAAVQFSGHLEQARDGFAFGGAAHVRRLTADRLASLLGRELDIRGTLSGDINISGLYRPNARAPLQDVTASGNISIDGGTIYGLPVSNGTVQLSLQKNILSIQDTQFASLGAKLGLSGEFNLANNNVSASFEISSLNIPRLRKFIAAEKQTDYDFARLDGELNLSGKIAGSLSKPVAILHGNVENLAINYQRFENAEFDFRYSDGVLSDINVELSHAGQIIALNAEEYNLTTNCVVNAVGKLESLSIPRLRQMVSRSPYLLSKEAGGIKEKLQTLSAISRGTLNGFFQANGCLNSLNGSIALTASNILIDTQTIEIAKLNAQVSRGAINLDEFQIVSGDMTVSAIGKPAYRNGQVQLEVSLQNLDASRLSPWLGDKTPGGVISALFDVTGDISSPYIIGSVEWVNPSYEDVFAERLRASRIEFLDDHIEISDVILAANGQQAVAQGNIPWNWSTLSIPNNRPLELSARLNRQSIAGLSSFIPLINSDKTSGTLEAELLISGTISEPVLSGGVRVENGTVSVKGFINEFKNINVDVVFDRDRAIINRASMESDLGGRIFIEPGGYVQLDAFGDGIINAILVAENFNVAERNVFGYQENVSLKLNSSLLLTGPTSSPVLADISYNEFPGGITITDARIAYSLPKKPPVRELLALPFNPKFQNITLRIGNNVVINPPNISLEVMGTGTLMGSLASPMVPEMALVIQQGNLRLAASRLRVVPKGLIYITYDMEKLEARVNFQAVTSVSATSAFGRRDRYDIILTVRGNIEEPQVELASSPAGLTREQMLAALGHFEGIFTSGEAQLEQELGNILTAVGTSALFAPIEELFVERLGFEQFSLEVGPLSPLALYVSRSFLDKFYISYYQRLTSNFAAVDATEWDLRFGYRIAQKYRLSYGINNQSISSIQAEYATRF